MDQQYLKGAMDWLTGFTVPDLVGLGVTAFVTLVLVLLIRLALPALLERLGRRWGWVEEKAAWPRLVTPMWLVVVLVGGWALLVME